MQYIKSKVPQKQQMRLISLVHCLCFEKCITFDYIIFYHIIFIYGTDTYAHTICVYECTFDVSCMCVCDNAIY